MSATRVVPDFGRFVRATHPYAYKSGEWAQIAGEVERNGRPCWLIVWADGKTDEWVVDDPHAGYEFADAVPITDQGTTG